MSTYVFADEAGCFTFSRKPNVSKYFILCTVTTKSLDICNALHVLRHRLVWQGAPIGDYFHASEDKQVVRDAVFAELIKHQFLIHATILEKSKAQPQVRVSKARFYKYPWFYHFSHGVRKNIDADNPTLVTAASVGNKKEKLTFSTAINDVMAQTISNAKWAVDFRPSISEYGLQAADYCAWAIQKRWELKDDRSFSLIAERVVYEYDLWKRGTKHYY
jgi:hypothetical protein